MVKAMKTTAQTQLSCTHLLYLPTVLRASCGHGGSTVDETATTGLRRREAPQGAHSMRHTCASTDSERCERREPEVGTDERYQRCLMHCRAARDESTDHMRAEILFGHTGQSSTAMWSCKKLQEIN